MKPFGGCVVDISLGLVGIALLSVVCRGSTGKEGLVVSVFGTSCSTVSEDLDCT